MKKKLQNLQRHSLVLVLLTLLALAPGMKGWGQLLLNENFSYPVGTLLTANGWTAHSGTGTNNIAVTAASINYTGYASSGIGDEVILNTSGQDVNKTFASQTSGSVYASFLVNVTASQATGDYFFHIGPTPTSDFIFQCRVFIKKDAATTNFAFGLNKASTAGTLAYSGFNYTPGTTYLVVAKYTFNAGSTTDDVVSLFINPALNSVEPAPLLTVTDPLITDLTKADFVALRQGSASNTPTLKLDGIRIGTNWADVVNGTVTAPATQASEISFSNVTTSGMTATWTNGDGGNRAVFMKQDITGTASPVNNTTYTASTTFGLGTEAGTGWFCVFNGPGNTVTVTGLTPSTNYIVMVCEYNGAAGGEQYNTSMAVDNPNTVTTLALTSPIIAVNPLSLSGFTAVSGTASASQNYTVSGDYLVADVTVTAPSKYEVSTNDVNFTPSVVLPQSGGNIIGEPKTVYVRIAATAPGGAANGDVAHTSTNATPVNLAVTGIVYFPEPSNHASGFVATATGFSSVSVTWSDNDGAQPATGFLILANTTGTFTDPVDGIPQADDVVLSDGSGVKNVVHGVQTYTWTGLTPSTPYYFVIYAYTNSGTFIDYKVIPAAPTANVTTPVYVEPLAAWTFDDTPGTPNTPTSIAANVGTQLTATFYADGTNGSSLWSTVTELNTFTGTTLNDPRISPVAGKDIALVNMSANGKSVVFKYSMIGYIDPVLSFAVRGTLTGFNNHNWEWSTDNITYTPFGTNTADNTTNYVLRTLDMGSINALDQASEVYLRLTLSGATTTGGNNRLDNVVLRATSAAVTTPTVQAHDITFGSVLANSMTVNWTNGDGAKRIVIMNTSNSFTDPIDGTDPAANTVYGGSGEQVVYNNSGSSVFVTGLTASTAYWFRVYEYNGGLTETKYLITAATLNPNSQITSPPSAVAPTIIDPVSSVITDNSALLGGNITNDGGAAISERGTVWNTITGVTIDDNKLAEGGLTIGIFSHTRSPLPAKTQIFFKAYATNSAGTTLTSEASFFTLATEPTSHVTGFTATAAGTSSIDLAWTAPATGADGYLILKRAGADAPTGIPSDATGYTVGTSLGDGTVAANVLSGATLSQTIAGLAPASQYSFTIIPYAYDGLNYQTYNYYTAPTIPSSTATTFDLPPGALLYEGFDYPAGEYIGGNGAVGSTSNNWTTHSVTTGQTTTIDILTGNLSYTGLAASTGNKVYLFSNANVTSRDVNRAIPSNTNTVMYFSALINVLDNSQLNATFIDNTYFMHFSNASGVSAGAFFGRIYIRSSNSGYRLGIQNTSQTTPSPSEFTTDLAFGSTYLVVVKYDFNGTSPDIATLWVDPSSIGGTEPGGGVTNSTGTGTGISTFGAICLRNASATPKAEIDEIRVGTSWADVTPPGIVTKTLNLKLYLEGLYNTVTGLMKQAQGLAGPQFGTDIADKVTVELHEITPPYAISALYSPFTNADLKTDGTVTINTIPGGITGSYYVVIKHRNSIETWSKLGGVLFDGAGPISYDFTTLASQAYGDNQKLMSGVYAVYGGDPNQDGIVDGTDMALIDNASTALLAGYNPEDVNGDGIVDGSDMAMVDNNSTAIVSVQKP